MATFSRARYPGLLAALAAACSGSLLTVTADENVYLVGVPDYAWHAGCFGTAAGNLIGFWDRQGLPQMYTGPTGQGVAPLTSSGQNTSIRSLWASQAGQDGRPLNQPGHMEDYWQTTFSFESTAPDPYLAAGRAEHSPDSLGDFMGQSQRKYADLDGECTGNIDGFAFNFWDKTGNRRSNFTPPPGIRDIQSGLREWSRYRGYDATVSSQLVDVNPATPSGTGFTFEDLKAEINAGYPVLIILQNHFEYSRNLVGLPRANPLAHAILVNGYAITTSESGELPVMRFKTSWGQGDEFAIWNSDLIIASLPMRGAITYHPQPKITSMERVGTQIRLRWEGPNAILQDELSGASRPVHNYVVERATELAPGEFVPMTPSAAVFEALVPQPTQAQTYYRVRVDSE